MNFQQRLNAFIKLGQSFAKWTETGHASIDQAYIHNNWFTPENVKTSLKSWSFQLQSSKLNTWLEKYDLGQTPKRSIAIIMAGNIPLVGFHDLVCVLITGNKALVKLSSDDSQLMKTVIDELLAIESDFNEFIEIIPDRLPKSFDAVIATGSNNTHRYFDYYFRNKPSLLRKNRNSVAILTGNETPEDFQKLGKDVFTYFGLGCRNVSKLYVPADFDFPLMLDQFISFAGVVDHNKYMNNYTYHKSIFLMNRTLHLDNGFLLVREDKRIASPLSVLHYESYVSKEQLDAELNDKAEEIQCIVGKTAGHVPFGKTQDPEWDDYADGVDTLNFLLHAKFE
jgi:hypothetical protein